MVSHMRPDQRIQGPLQVQAPFSLCPSSTFLRVVLALDGFDSRSRQGQTQRLMRVFTPKTQILELFPNSGDGRLSSSNNDRGGLTDGITDPR